MANRRLIGYWRENGDPDWPDPADFVDPEWDRGERRAVALYLDSGASSASTVEIPVALGPSTCRLCGIRNGFDEQCDASYLWPRGLAHYVEAHSVRLPREFIDHVREQVRDRNESELDPTWWKISRPRLTQICRSACTGPGGCWCRKCVRNACALQTEQYSFRETLSNMHGGPMPVGVRRAASRRCGCGLCCVGWHAFADYPWTQWTVESYRHSERVEGLQRLSMDRIALPYGEIWVACDDDDDVISVAVWMLPNSAVPASVLTRSARRKRRWKVHDTRRRSWPRLASLG